MCCISSKSSDETASTIIKKAHIAVGFFDELNHADDYRFASLTNSGFKVLSLYILN
jgi:hypothetical protein